MEHVHSAEYLQTRYARLQLAAKYKHKRFLEAKQRYERAKLMHEAAQRRLADARSSLKQPS